MSPPGSRPSTSSSAPLSVRTTRTSAGAETLVAVSGASILSSVTRADGFAIVPGDSEGYPEGTEVEVFLY